MSASETPSMAARLSAEALGTGWLVFGGCGTAIFAATYIGTASGVGWVGVALAFGLTVLTGAYAFGPVSGGHFNPAVTCGLAAAKRFSWSEVPAYVAAQLVGGIVAAAGLFAIASGRSVSLSTGTAELKVKPFAPHAIGGFAVNGYDKLSPMGYGLGAVIAAEVILTAVFVYVILGATAKRAAVGFAGLSIGLALTLIHLISIPIDNTSVNPARSIAVAVFAGGDALLQVWVFILAPVAGALLAGFTHSMIFGREGTDALEEDAAA